MSEFELRTSTSGDFVSLYTVSKNREAYVTSGTVQEMFDMFAQIVIVHDEIGKIEDCTLQNAVRHPRPDDGRRFWVEADHIMGSDQWYYTILERKPQSRIYECGREWGWQLNSTQYDSLMQAVSKWFWDQEASE